MCEAEGIWRKEELTCIAGTIGDALKIFLLLKCRTLLVQETIMPSLE